MTREELIAKVEGLTVPDQEVDSAVDGIACGRKFNFGFLPHYTSSVDAVLALLQERLPGWRVTALYKIHPNVSLNNWRAELRRSNLHNTTVKGQAVTPALALLAATLRALASREAGAE